MSAPPNKEDDSGLDVVFRVAEEDLHRPYSGLTLLSQVCIEEGLEVQPMGSQFTGSKYARVSKRVGLRPPINEARTQITLLTNNEVADRSCREIYQYYCKQYKTKPNSLLLSWVYCGDAMVAEPLCTTNHLKLKVPLAQSHLSISCFMSFVACLGRITLHHLHQQLPADKGVFTLQDMELNGNFIGDRGILPLLEVARLNPQLKRMSLHNNGIKNSGVECLVHMCLEHQGLSSLDLSHNRISLGSGKVLQELAKKNKNMVNIVVNDTRIDEQLQQRIEARVKQNRDAKSQG
eukprot:TRINITY_DN56742_c0_g1_i2.p1 TRINITY_DN56742_c0_g1~~TRINITY_DN56742_c0_g1_i2.p1  ORF type:complete len:291 (+),score=12.35 TRINITY_DN56742_c0_g1_i2:38-910(+)